MAAMDLLVDMLNDVPKELPREIEATMADADQDDLTTMGSWAALAMFSLLTFAPLMFWMGIRDRWTFVTVVALVCVAGVAEFVVTRVLRTTAALIWLMFAIFLLFTGSISVLFGPFLVVPGIAVVVVMVFVVHRKNRRPFMTILLTMLSVLLPSSLQLLGVLPQSYLIEDNTLVVVPWMLDFPSLPTWMFLTLASAVTIVLAGLLGIRFRVALLDSERSLHWRAWQLNQLISQEEQGGRVGRKRGILSREG